MAQQVNLLIATYHLDKGGLEEVVRTYAALLDKTKYTIVVACINHGVIASEIAKIPGVKVVHVSPRGRIGRFLMFYRIARDLKADIVHNHACWYGLIVGLLVGAKRVETVHNIYQWMKPLERIHYGLYCMLAQRIIAVSDEVRKYTIASFPFMKDKKFTVVYNGIRCEPYLKRHDVSSLRRDMGIAEGSVVLGFVGRLTEQKGLTYLFDALDTLNRTHPGVVCVIVGDGDLAAALQESVRERKLSNVRFAGYQRDIPRYLQMFDIFVLPSLWEGLPMSVIEAMAAGVPVVATNVGGTAEVVLDGRTGFIVGPKDVPKLAERIGFLIEHPGERKAMGTRGQERVLERFSGTSMVAGTEKIYGDLLHE